MARRCPDADDPRPAVLSDHDWLINERGVATVEPFTGNDVHGVLWRISEDDLAALDSAEGVPVRYRRDRLTSTPTAGPRTAWVYIDHRVNPGPPRPGYLQRIIDGAVHHGLPQRWIDFLRRWDPARWPRPRSRPATPAPQSLSELLSEAGVVEVSLLRSRFGFLAIHGGGLEEMTDVIAERAADAADASVYLLGIPTAIHITCLRLVSTPRSRRAWPSSSTTSTSRFRCTATAESAVHAIVGRRPQPRAGRPSGAAPRPARLSGRHRSRGDPAPSCAACIRTTRSTGCATAGRNWSCRSASGA